MNSLKTRIAKLEKGIGDSSIVARTEDGQTFRLRRDNLLPLTVASFRRRYAEIEGLPMPVSPFDERLDYLKRAGVARTNEPMLELACDALRRNNE
jgi:hypothetical protein